MIMVQLKARGHACLTEQETHSVTRDSTPTPDVRRSLTCSLTHLVCAATDDVTTMATSTTAAALLLSARRLNVRRTAHVNAATVMSYLGLPVHTAASEEADERLETEAMP